MTKRTTADRVAPAPLWSPDDVAAFVGVPVSTIYRWNYRGEGPPYKRVGKYVRYSAEDVLDWLANRPGGAGAA